MKIGLFIYPQKHDILSNAQIHPTILHIDNLNQITLQSNIIVEDNKYSNHIAQRIQKQRSIQTLKANLLDKVSEYIDVTTSETDNVQEREILEARITILEQYHR